MNERIRELVRQAGLDNANFPIENWDNVPLAKFAELIIQEAGEAFWSEACHVSDLAYEEYYRNRKKIRQHFEVEL